MALTPPMIFEVPRRIAFRDRIETARRGRESCGQAVGFA
jgi:hypothetical protein